MTDFSKTYPSLKELLSFLNQDWKLMFEWDGRKPSYQLAIKKLKIDDSPEVRVKNIEELQKLISLNYDELTLKNIINNDFGSAFYPPGVGLTYQQWLEDILYIYQEPVEKTKKEYIPKFAGEN